MDRVCPAFRITIPTLALQGMIGRIASAPPPRAQPSTSTRTSICKKAATGACTRVHWSSPRRRLSRESRLVSSRRERLVAQGPRFYPASPPLPYPDRVPACVRACVRARASGRGARCTVRSRIGTVHACAPRTWTTTRLPFTFSKSSSSVVGW